MGKDNTQNGGPNDYSHDSNAAAAKLAKAQKRNTFIILGIVVFLVGGYFLQRWVEESNKDYIGGNVLSIAQTGSASVGNPWKNASFVGQLVFRGLFNTDSSFEKVEPGLCSGYTVSDDGLVYTLTLKDGLKWSDGQPLTVDDVVWSIESFLLCENTNVTISTAFKKIKGAEAWMEGKTDSLEGISADGNKITIELDNNYNQFALVLTQFPPMPAHALEGVERNTITDGIEFYTDPVTSGMYKVEGLNAEGDYTLVINPNYDGNPAQIEKVIMYKDYQTRSIDQYSTTNITEMVSYRSMTGFEEYPVDVYFYRYFVFNLMGGYELRDDVPLLDENGTPVLDEDGNPVMTAPEPIEYDENRPENVAMQDVLVRQAITHAIDRETLLKDVYYGTGSTIYGGAMGIADEAVYEYNPTKAKELLEQSGYDMSRPFVIAHYYKDNTSLVFLDKVSEYLEAIGLTVELSWNSAGALYVDREYDMMLKGLSSFSTEDWYNEFLSDNTNMSALFGTDQFDELVHTMSSTTSESEKRATMEALVALEQSLQLKMPLFILNDSVYINANRVEVPEDITFGNTRYRSDLRLDEWSIKKG